MEEEDNINIPIRTKHQDASNIPIRKPKPVSQKTALQKTFDNTGGITRGFNTGYGESKYDDYLNWDAQIGDNIQQDINENRANQESNLAKVGAGIGRIGTKAVSEILKIPGVVGGIAMAPFAEDGEGWETAFNNQWIKSISHLNEEVNSELLPVYVKKAVSEGNLWDNISSIDFWATEGADGIGFIASMFAPGAALKSLNLGHKVLGTTAKGLSMINGETKLAGAVRTLEGLGINANSIDLGAMTMANTLIESGSEAGSAMNSFQKDLDRRLTLPETDPNYINQAQYQQLQTQKAKLGRDIFVSNLAILLVPNAIQTKMIWGKGIGSQLVKDTPSLMTKIGNRGKNVLGALGSEGFLEEGTQSTVETMFTNKANKGQLTNNMLKDFNVSELVSSYIDTLNTTDGQKAIFLGGFLGGGMSAYQGGKSDIATRKESADVLDLAERTVGVFNRVNETDPYKKDENGDIVYNYNNKPQYDPVKIRDIAEALNYTDEQSQLFDQAIQEGNEQVIQTLKNESINQLITPFINKGELGIQALSQYLDTTLKTEEIAENEDAKALKGKIIERATYMQDQLNTYKDFSKSLINLNNSEATPQDTIDYYNMLGDLYTNLKGSEYFQKDELKKLNIQKSKLLKDLGTNEITKEFNTDFVEGTTEDVYKFKKADIDPRVKLINEQIEQVNNNLSKIDKVINDEIWNNEKVNESFNKRVKENNKLREQDSAENEAIVNEAVKTIATATTVDELQNLPKTNTPVDKVIQQQANEKEVEIIATEEAFNETEREIATQEDNDFNNIQTYDGLTATEGSIITDELIPKDSENNTSEELKTIDNEEVLVGKGAQVISTNMRTGELFSFVSESYLNYERNPINKTGKEVGFEINFNPGPNENLKKSLKMIKDKDFSNPAFLISYLPINVTFEKGIKAPMETRRANGKLDSKKDKDGKDQFYINPATEILRSQIINHLVNGGSISDIKTTIQDQYKGLLKVDENRFANNNILELDGVKDLKYVRDNLYVVDSFGNLMNIQSGKTKTFSNGKTKKNAAGEIYLSIPQANGKPFPLKLNIKKINESEAILLYEIYKEIITNDNTLNTTVSEVNPELQEAILTSFNAELDIIGGNKNDIKLQEIVDLLIYQSDNIKSRMQIENGILYFGENEADINNIEDSQNAIINYLVDSKRHQIKINPKFATDNTKTNLKSNSANYLKYLIDNGILTTNAVVNEPTFQGYTNIYLNTGITVNNQPKSNIEAKKAAIEIRRKSELTIWRQTEQDESTTGQEMDDQKAAINAKYDVELAALTQPKVSESGVEVKTDNTGFDEMFNTSEMGNDVLDILKEFETEPKVENKVLNKIKGFVENKDDNIINLNEQNTLINIEFDKNANLSNYLKSIKVVPLKSYLTEKVNINPIRLTIVNRANFEKINENTIIVTTSLELKSNSSTITPVKITLSGDKVKLFLDKVTEANIARDDYKKLGFKDINEAMRGVDASISVAAKKLNQIVKDSLDKLLENNQENTRNVQENFLSLSEIKGTVENTQLNETQADVFNENKIPPTATEMRLINKAITVYQEDASKLTEAQKKRLEEYAANYPESWKKICK